MYAKRPVFACALLASAVLLSFGATSQARRTSTLTLDELSFVRFDDQVFPIPAGSTIRFRFGEPSAAGIARLRIDPEDVQIPPLVLANEDETLRFGLAASAAGRMMRQENGAYRIELSAVVSARLGHPSEAMRGIDEIPLVLTTEVARLGQGNEERDLRLQGARVAPESRYVQLVSSVPSRLDGYPSAEHPIHAVLSGSFDWLP